MSGSTTHDSGAHPAGVALGRPFGVTGGVSACRSRWSPPIPGGRSRFRGRRPVPDDPFHPTQLARNRVVGDLPQVGAHAFRQHRRPSTEHRLLLPTDSGSWSATETGSAGSVRTAMELPPPSSPPPLDEVSSPKISCPISAYISFTFAGRLRPPSCSGSSNPPGHR